MEMTKNSDHERLRILISMTICAIWKSRIKKSINNQDVTPNETRETPKDLIADLVRKSWNAARFMESETRQRDLRTLRVDKQIADFDLMKGPTVYLS